MSQQKNPQVEAQDLHNEIVERFSKRIGSDSNAVRTLEAAREITDQLQPQFTEPQLVWLQSLVVTTQADAPITPGFSTEQMMEYASRIGRYNGMLDILVYIADVAENNLVTKGN